MRTTSALALAAFVALGGCERRFAGVSLMTRSQAAPWNGGPAGGLEMTTRRYRIYTTAAEPLLLKHLPGFLEAACDNYLLLTGLPDRPDAAPMTVYMMGSRSEWADLTRAVVKSNLEAYLAVEAGGYCYQGVCVYWDMGGLGTLSVAAHEGMHQFLARRTRQPLPMWAEEGLCVTAEGCSIEDGAVAFTPERNPFRFSDLRAAIIQDRWIPLKRLLSMDAGDVTTQATERAVGYYGQLWALIMYVRSQPGYAGGLARMIADAQAGTLHNELQLQADAIEKLRVHSRLYNRTLSEPLFRRYVTQDLDRFEQQYRRFARRFVRLE